MKIITEALEGAALDWAVAKAEGLEPHYTHEWMAVGWPEKVRKVCVFRTHVSPGFFQQYNPSDCWYWGGPLIEREGIQLELQLDEEYAEESDEVIQTYAEEPYWSAFHTRKGGYWYYAKTPLQAAMKCYVGQQLGDEVEIPDELIKEGKQA